MARNLRGAVGTASSAVVLLLAGCGTSTLTVMDGAPPVTRAKAAPAGDEDPVQVVGGQVTVAPSLTTGRQTDGLNEFGCPPDPEIPEGVDFEDLEIPGVHAATQEAAKRYGEPIERGKTGPYFTGISVCLFAGYFYVYRVPGSKKFDAWFSKIARKHDVGVRFVDRKYSLATLEGVRKQLMSRQDELAAVGASVIRTHPEFVDGCYIEAGVFGDVAAARRVLADMGDKVNVVKGGRGAQRLSGS